MIGPFDYNLYTNSQLDTIADINRLPLKTVGGASVMVGDVGQARTPRRSRPTSCASTDSARSICPILKQGGDVNTIAVVDGIKQRGGRICSMCRSRW